MSNIQSSINQVIGFIGKMNDQFDEAQNEDSFTPSNIKVGNQRNKKYQNSTARNNYKSVMKELANKVNDRKKMQNLHNEFMKFIRPEGTITPGV